MTRYPNAGLDDAAVAARARLLAFIDVLQHPEPPASAGPTPYPPAQLAVFVLGPASAAAGEKATATWPLGDLASAGAPSDRR